MRPGYTLFAGILLALAFARPASAAEKPRVDFEREILPLLKDRCYQCHDGHKHPSGLRFDLKASADYIDSVRGSDVELNKQGNTLVATATWSKTLPLIGNASILLDFQASASK